MINLGCGVPRSPLSRELQYGIAGVSRKEDPNSREKGGIMMKEHGDTELNLIIAVQ
jgi:hypothetical protein